MDVSVFGLGYVGAVTLGCLSRDGIMAIGVDVSPEKVAIVNAGKAPIIELGLSELLDNGLKMGLLSATVSAREAVAKSEVSFISVGTPTKAEGGPDLAYVHRVCEEIGDAVKAKGKAHIVVVRSTVLPGTTAECAKILKEHAGGVPIHVAFNPEFLREGTAIKDYDSPGFTIIGTSDPVAEKALRDIYGTIMAPVIVTSCESAEMIKFTANAWHATKITFANEIGRLAKRLGVDGREVMEIITKDTKLNVSPAYMRPGFAYGGSCLPKDVRALIHVGRIRNIDVPLLDSLAESNHTQVEWAANLVLARGKRRIGILGLAFKPGTDDLRESPAVDLAEFLIGKGMDIRILDRAVSEAKLVGSNKRFIEERIPHLSAVLVSTADELIKHAQIIVITHGSPEFRAVLAKVDRSVPIIDLAGAKNLLSNHGDYEGIAW
jgi:GDP-mannose 6-dehydrogenase